MGRETSWNSLRRLALLAASILSSCFLLAEGQAITLQVQIQLQPPHPAEGQNLTLTPTPRDDVEKAYNCRWYKGLTTDSNQLIYIYYISLHSGTAGVASTGQETVGPGCSLHIRNVTSGNTGNFTVQLDGPGINPVEAHASVVVSVVLHQPTMSVSPSTIPFEFSNSVQLTCATNSRYANVSWLWNGGPLNNSSRIQLSDDDWVLDIKGITRNDAGMYQCQVSNLVSNETSNITYIDVIYGPDAPVIQPDKHSYLVHTDIQLECTASSVPVANYSWFFNEKNVIKESVLLIQNITHEHSGRYTCQALNVLTHRMASTTLEIEVVGDVYDVTITGPSTGIENRTVSLNCTSVGDNVSYSWLKGEQLMEPGDNVFLTDNNQTLTFDQSTRDDTANYTCYAFNNFSSDSSEPHWLEIFYGPDAPIISSQETLYVVGSNLTLSCFANSTPPANYSWYRNGQLLKLQNTSRLFIPDLSWADEGNYTCYASNDATGRLSDATLEISLMKRVTNVTISGPDKAFENITVLSCSSDGTNVSYYWLKGNQSPGVAQHIFLSSDNKTLTFNQTMRSDSGNYTCYGKNSFSEANRTYTLNVLYGPDVPKIDPSNATQYYPEGGTLNLSCEADSNPHAQYTWLINGSEVARNQPQLLRNNLSFNNSGNYTCSVFNSETNQSNFAIVKIYVQENLTSPVLSTSAHGMVEENTNVTLNCSTSNTSGVNVIWFKDDKLLPASTDLSDRDRILTLTRVTKSNAGLYRCNASNFVSSAKSNSVNIAVAYGPVIQLNAEGTVEKSLNSDLKLECTADSVPGARFQWFLNNTKREATGSIVQGSLLQVLLSNWADEGNYTCQATNPFTNSSATKTVYVKLTAGSSSNPGTGLSDGAIAGIVIGSLAGVALVAGLLYFICTKTSLGRMELHASNGNVPSAPGHNEGVTDTKPKPAEEDLQYSILAFKDTNRSPPRPTSEASQPSDGVTIYSEIKKK